MKRINNWPDLPKAVNKGTYHLVSCAVSVVVAFLLTILFVYVGLRIWDLL